MRIGIDIGGTRIKAGVLAASGDAVVTRRVLAVGGARSDDDVVVRLARVVAALEAEVGAGAEAVGVAAAGVLDARRGVIRESPNFPSWADFALGARLEEACGRPVTLENDANAVIYGEARAGAGRGHEHLIGLTLGTGVGGGVILGGQVWRGARGMAGELGHVTVDPGGRPCGCGNRGCLEQYVGAVGLRQTVLELGGDLAGLADSEDLPRLLAELARRPEGDEAREVWVLVGRYLGQAIAGFVHALDVTCVVLAGGIATAADLFLPATESSFRARSFLSMSEGVRIVAGTLGEDAGIIGAALAAQAPGGSLAA